MKNNSFETLIGTVVLVIAGLFLYISLKISGNTQKLTSGYEVNAEFTNIEGINIGSDVKIAGVKVGNVLNVRLDKNYNAIATIKLPNNLLIPTDSIFKISTSGLIGSKFINIKIGANEEYLENGKKAEFTESIMDLEDLISRFIFNNGNKNENSK